MRSSEHNGQVASGQASRVQPKRPRAARSKGPESRVVCFMESWLVKGFVRRFGRAGLGGPMRRAGSFWGGPAGRAVVSVGSDRVQDCVAEQAASALESCRPGRKCSSTWYARACLSHLPRPRL
jgi:hypothetical protein